MTTLFNRHSDHEQDLDKPFNVECRMTNVERNPKPESQKALSCAIGGLVIRISSFVIRICEEWTRTRTTTRPNVRYKGRAGVRAAFTLIELLVVIAIIALLAGLIVGGTKYAGTQMKVSRIRTELQALEAAIEAYHAKFNHYPPDNVVQRSPLVVNSVTNSLYYELTGVIAEDANGKFRSPNQSAGITPAMLQQYFGVD